jgi:hypothetical protein
MRPTSVLNCVNHPPDAFLGLAQIAPAGVTNV